MTKADLQVSGAGSRAREGTKEECGDLQGWWSAPCLQQVELWGVPAVGLKRSTVCLCSAPRTKSPPSVTQGKGKTQKQRPGARLSEPENLPLDAPGRLPLSTEREGWTSHWSGQPRGQSFCSVVLRTQLSLSAFHHYKPTPVTSRSPRSMPDLLNRSRGPQGILLLLDSSS